jgi:hypothetical protein
MNSHEIVPLLIIHVASVLGLTGATFFAFGGAPETRKRVLMLSGIASLLVVLTGVRMWQVEFQFHGGWAVVKLFCWLGVSAIGGIAYRRQHKACLFAFITLVLLVTAVTMVFVKPF